MRCVSARSAITALRCVARGWWHNHLRMQMVYLPPPSEASDLLSKTTNLSAPLRQRWPLGHRSRNPCWAHLVSWTCPTVSSANGVKAGQVRSPEARRASASVLRSIKALARLPTVLRGDAKDLVKETGWGVGVASLVSEGVGACPPPSRADTNDSKGDKLTASQANFSSQPSPSPRLVLNKARRWYNGAKSADEHGRGVGVPSPQEHASHASMRPNKAEMEGRQKQHLHRLTISKTGQERNRHNHHQPAFGCGVLCLLTPRRKPMA